MSESDTLNLPPADRLAAVRAQIKALQDDEAGLKSLMIADPSARTGNNYVAVVRTVTAKRLNQQALKDLYPEVYADNLLTSSHTQVDIMAITDDGEIVSARKPRSK